MNNDFRLKVVTSAILLALLLSVAMPLAALAQDETSTPTPTLENSATLADTATPEPSATETAAAPSETPTPTDSAPTDTETPSETPTPDLSATATATLSSETPTATVTLTETPTITPTHGLPLESSVFDLNEVIWCPASVAAPVEGSMGCVGPYTELNDLRNNLGTAASVDGKIWIGANYAGTADASFSNANVPNLFGKKLTFQGGWIGPGGTIDTGDPSEVDHQLQVTNWGADVALNDMIVDGATMGDNIVVTTSGKITILRVFSTGANNGQLASLNNTAGSADVVITDSFFNVNTSVSQCGLVVDSDGMITLSGVQASANNYCGADLENNGTKGISITGSSFNNNTNNAGLVVDSTAAIALTNVTAINNGSYGISIDNTGGTSGVTVTGGTANGNTSVVGDGMEIISKGAVTVSGFSANSNSNGNGLDIHDGGAGTGAIAVSGTTLTTNGGNGLIVTAKGMITLTSVTATFNSGNGADIDNTSGTAGFTASTSTFSSNTNKGLNLLTNGAIMFTSLTANSNNGTAGVSASNTSASTPKNVTISGANEISNNRENGLVVNTKGSITTNDISANGNGIVAGTGNGVSFNNTFGANPGMGVTLNGTNYLSGNQHHGILINSYGPIKLNNAFANSSVAGYGAFLTNDGATTAQGVTLTGSSQFNYNSLIGLNIVSKGAVMLNNITANGTVTQGGAVINNDFMGFSSGVTLTGTNVFLENSSDGLAVTSRGAITASNVTSNDSAGGYGIYFSNTSATTNMAASLTGVNSANGNFYDGVVIESNGVISVASVTANDSIQGAGISLNNTTAAIGAKMGVNISGSNVANNNGQAGVVVQTHGAIVATTISASGNGAFGGSFRNGIYFKNDTAATPMAVTLNGTNTLNDNVHEGLEILSLGAVKANSVTANGNDQLGLYVFTPSTSGVTLTGVNSFDANLLGGVDIDTAGPIVLSNVSADNNLGSHGIDLNNTAAGTVAPKNVTLSGVNTASGNWLKGLTVNTYGDISVASITATANGVSTSVGQMDGVYLNNTGGTLARKVTLTGTSVISANPEDGLEVYSLGAISVSNLTTNGNQGDYGASLSNSSAVDGVGITLTGTNTFNANARYGLAVDTHGPITASNLTAIGNLSADHEAIYFSNQGAGSAQNVTVTGVNTLAGNGDDGMVISTRGSVAVNSISSTGNLSGYGLLIQNAIGLANSAKGVTLTGTNVLSNNVGGDGLNISTYGPVAIANLTANSNTSGYGAIVNNSGSANAQKVSFTGLNTFNSNGLAGVNVFSKGAITSATGLTALNNTGDGIYLNNAQDLAAPTDVTLSGSNKANDNTIYGLRVISYGAISVNNVTAISNNTFGLELANNTGSNVKDMKLTGTNVVSENTSTNVTLNSLGAISVNNLTASESVNGNGVDILNLTEGKGVTFTGSSFFNLNDDHGALITTLGNFVGSNLNASLNGQSGSGLGLQINNESAASPRSVTVTGTNVFIDNDEEGLAVYSKGVVTLNNVRAHLNSLGLLIDNDNGTAAVNLNGVNSFRNNSSTGVRIRSLGAVTVNKVTADNNAADGLFVDPTGGNVSVMCGFFTSNSDNGLDISTTGIIKLVGVVTAGNTNDQAMLVSPNPVVVVRACP